MLSIYTITAIPLGHRQSPRCFGFYYFLPFAVDAVLANKCDMQESYYSYIVIEKIGTGIHAHATDVMWFCWFEDFAGRWEQCERPTSEQFDGIINFNGIG